MNVIEISHLTRNYGNGRGVFDVTFAIEKGEVFGFLGPNGAGKTTTIRHLMGFLSVKEGSCKVLGMDCKKEASKIQKKLGYLPGEIAFVEDMKGMQFIHFIGKYRNMKQYKRAYELIQMFEFNPDVSIKKMSKGMKQKLAIVCAFMDEPEVVILDEPTSGLDPLMQNKFVELTLEEKAKGTTILMSSHMFEEVERTCDRVGIIKDGKMAGIEKIDTLKNEKRKIFVLTFQDVEDAEQFAEAEEFKIVSREQTVVSVQIKKDVNQLIHRLGAYELVTMDVQQQSLEDFFMHFYGGELHDK